MLVVVRRPHTEFSLNGDVPVKLIQSLVSEYGPDNVKIKEDDMMNVEDMEWYKEEKAKDTPGKALRFYRKLKGMTQPELAEMIGSTKQFISNFENDRKPISRMMAKKLSEISNCTIQKFLTMKSHFLTINPSQFDNFSWFTVV